VISRGEVLVEQGELHAEPGRGRFLRRAPIDLTGMPGHQALELDPARYFDARIAP
jgi:dihydropyrimidinase